MGGLRNGGAPVDTNTIQHTQFFLHLVGLNSGTLIFLTHLVEAREADLRVGLEASLEEQGEVLKEEGR